MNLKNKYDVVVIGAGIGGLVCACYLAKKGLNVLVAEKHATPGGCCGSFKRKGFVFDVGTHYLGSLREGGILFKVLDDLSLLAKIKFIRSDPTDFIITPDVSFGISVNFEKTKQELSSYFPKEKRNIYTFFDFINRSSFFSMASKTKGMTFSKILDSFFTNYKLKMLLSIPLGCIGLPASAASALVACVLYKEFILDGGYYPLGGMQTLPDALAQAFQKYGGVLALSTEVTSINIDNRRVLGVQLNNVENIAARWVVSNADATLTFKRLLECQTIERKKIDMLSTSPSAFLVHLGLKKKIINKKIISSAMWIFDTYDIDKCYLKNKISDLLDGDLSYIFCNFQAHHDSTIAPVNKDILRLFIGCKYEEEISWDEVKEKIYRKIISKIQRLIPDIEDLIEVKLIATPNTFKKFTYNTNGALFGWAATPSQVNRKIFPTKTTFDNLYLTGHWVTNGIGQSGVAMVTHSGQYTAMEILKREANMNRIMIA